MSTWETGLAKHDVQMPGSSPSVGVWVLGAIESENSERPKFLIEERADNKGASLHDPEVLSTAVKDVSASLDIRASEADWYMLGKDNELYALDVEERDVVRENPQWLDLQRSGDLSIHEQEAASQAFPEVVEREVSAQARPIGDMESIDIGIAFDGPRFEGGEQPDVAPQYTLEEWKRASMDTELPEAYKPEAGPEFDL